MDKSLVKRAYSEAEDSLKEKQVDEVKRIVLKTLEKIETLRTDKDKAQESVKDIDEKIRLLKMDLDDLKEGRLDRLAERQEKDERAKQTSVVIIIKEREVVREVSPWYWPWRVVWPDPVFPTVNQPVTWTYYTNSGNDTSTLSYGSNAGTMLNDIVALDQQCSAITCSSAKWGAAGTYDVNGHIVNFR